MNIVKEGVLLLRSLFRDSIFTPGEAEIESILIQI